MNSEVLSPAVCQAINPITINESRVLAVINDALHDKFSGVLDWEQAVDLVATFVPLASVRTPSLEMHHLRIGVHQFAITISVNGDCPVIRLN